MNNASRHFYEFGRFRVDETERRLLRDGEFLPLPPKTFETLLVLVRNNGHLLTKNELMEKVWGNTFVEDNNLTQYVSALRKTLNDGDGQVIETVPRRGYRFKAAVREVWEEADTLLVEHRKQQRLRIEETIEEDTGEQRKWFWLPHWRFLVVVGLLLVFGAVSLLYWNQTRKPEARALSLISGTKNTEAFEIYQRGRTLWQTRSGENLHEATSLLEEAVQKDPQFALAHAALADCYAFDYRLWKQAEPATREAIRLDPKLGEPHATIGFVRMFWEWKLKEAESELKRAVQLSPNYATARQWYALNLLALGNAGSAGLVEMKKALELAPDSLSINADLCQTFYFLHRYTEAAAQCQKTLAMNPNFHNAYVYLYEISNAQGRSDEAVKTYFKIEELNPHPPPPDELAKIREAYRTGGIRAFWKARIEYLLLYNVPSPYRIAQHYARLGQQEEAFHHLERAYETRDFDFILFRADPVFDAFHANRRYKDLTRLLLPLDD